MNRLARYVGDGRVEIVQEPLPEMPEGGLIVRTEACGLCSGELMAWYMDRKLPHVLGHEVCGIVERSDSSRFPEGARVFVHHHAPCLACEFCQRGLYVHCETWRRTKLRPGGMAERFVASPDHLTDTFRVDDLRPIDAALIEPLACVEKSIAMLPSGEARIGIVGLGVMGLMHALRLPGSVGFDLSEQRRNWATAQGVDARDNREAEEFDAMIVCPGSQAAFDFALNWTRPGGTIVMFAPLPDTQLLQIPSTAYFRDIAIRNSYSAGPDDTRAAAAALRTGKIRAEQVVSDFVDLNGLPEAYVRMRGGDILKAMVVFE